MSFNMRLRAFYSRLDCLDEFLHLILILFTFHIYGKTIIDHDTSGLTIS